MQIRQRVERLEQHTEAEQAVMVVVGEATLEQRCMIDQGRVRLLIEMPDNGRGDHGRDSSKD